MTQNLADPYAEQAEGLINSIKALLEAEVDDTFCYRALINNYCAYQMGARNGKDKLGRWDTNKIRNSEQCHWSKKAWEELKRRKGKPKGEKKALHLEHVVPMNVIVKRLLDKAQTETGIQVKEIKETLNALVIFAVVTKDQHDELNKKYKHKMPDDFDNKGHPLEEEPFLRYIKCFNGDFNGKFEGNIFFELAPYDN